MVIDFWATWCGPCVAEMPKMKELYAKYRDKGVEFIGVSLDQPKEQGGLDKLKKFVKENEIAWPQYYQGTIGTASSPSLGGSTRFPACSWSTPRASSIGRRPRQARGNDPRAAREEDKLKTSSRLPAVSERVSSSVTIADQIVGDRQCCRRPPSRTLTEPPVSSLATRRSATSPPNASRAVP